MHCKLLPKLVNELGVKLMKVLSKLLTKLVQTQLRLSSNKLCITSNLVDKIMWQDDLIYSTTDQTEVG